jgi:plastocyanin domain-containing protein
MNKITIISIAIAAAVIAGALLFSRGSPPGAAPAAGNNVSIVDGTQVIKITAKGGYQPRTTTAKAGIPTVLKLETNGSFDCSSAVRIPSLGVSKNLPPSGSTDIDLGTPQVSTVRGVCAMGMYSFQINFET